jgi:thiol-disulfide isomerase/thioredoxin
MLIKLKSHHDLTTLRFPYPFGNIRFSLILLPFLLCLVSLWFTGCLQEGTGLSNQNTLRIEVRKEYPSGPYGLDVGSTIDNLNFTTPDDQRLQLKDLYDVDHNRVLLVTTSAEWCTACIKEQPKLKELYERYSSFGLNIMVTLFQDDAFSPATPQLAQTWKERYELPFLVTADPLEPSTFSPYYDINLTPMVMLVDVQTMKIMYLTQGFDEEQVVDLIETMLPSTPIRDANYPSEPYGKEAGDTMDNLGFTQSDGSSFNFNNLYQDHSKTLLLLTTSAEWCTACIKEQPKLEDLYQKYGSRGLQVMVSMFQDDQFIPATPDVARLWKEKYQLNFWVVADGESPSVLSEYYDVNLTPMVMFIDLTTMSILYVSQGFDEETVLSLIEQNLN